MTLRAGDILFCGGEGPVSELIRVFAPGDRGFKLRDLRNIGNKAYPTHVCQAIDTIKGIRIKDTRMGGLQVSELEHYTKARSRYIVAVVRLGIYDHPLVRKSLQSRTVNDFLRTRHETRYPVRDLLHYYVPGFQWLKPSKALLYCSERVHRDLHMDHTQYMQEAREYAWLEMPVMPCSPAELYVWVLSLKCATVVPQIEWGV